VDARVADEVVKAKRILEDLTTSNVLASPYLVSAFYYHDGFLNDFPVDRSSAAPERRIIGQISNLLTSEAKARFVRLLHEIWSRSDAPGPSRYAEPVAYRAVSGRRSHRYAIDLFAPEGTPVIAVSRGVVVLADRRLEPGEPVLDNVAQRRQLCHRVRPRSGPVLSILPLELREGVFRRPGGCG
jgi:murein DD-endopeptidase MepM/ murein hydrolase activator NlpD